MIELIYLAVVLIMLIVGFFILGKFRATKKLPEQPAVARNRQQNVAPRRVQAARNRGGRLRVNDVHNEIQPEVEGQPDQDEREIEIDNKIGAKKRAKLEAKAEKKAAREATEQLRAERKKQAELEDLEQQKQKEKEEAEEKKREEEERKAKEEKERKEYEEYLKMKEAFSVEEEGYEEGENEDEQNLLKEFVNHIKDNKVVIIEDLAAKFKLKTQVCIDRIKDLQKDDILTGVIDDRGKFIYISQNEIEAVAKFIRQRGRVSITELAEHSNQLINLVPVNKVVST